MAVIKMRAADSGYHTSVPVGHGPENAAQSWERGALLIADVATGEIDEGATDAVDLILGIAHAAASTVAGTDVMYTQARPGVRFLGSMGTSLTAGDLAAADLFAEYPLTLTTGDWFINTTDNTTPCVRIVEFVDPVGTTNATVIFEFLTDTLLMTN